MLQAKQKAADGATRGFLWIYARFILAALFLTGLFSAPIDLMKTQFRSEAVHSSLECMGAILGLSVLLVRRLDPQLLERMSLDHPAILRGLFAMSILDGAHALVPMGHLFVALHSYATLCGGVFFASIWIPCKTSRHAAPFWLAGGVAVALALSLALIPGVPLEFVKDGHFTVFAVGVNMTAGIGFLIGMLFFIRANLVNPKRSLRLLTILCLLFGVAALTFQTSSLWSETWWLWHFMRLGAYLTLGRIMMLEYQGFNTQLTQIRESVHANKLATLGEMAGGVAHEINNPLAIIHGRANLLLRQIKAGQLDTDKMKEDINSILATVERISKIVKGMKDMSHNAEGDPFVPFNLREVIDSTLGLCAERFKAHRIELRVFCDPQVMIIGRPIQISQVLLNLLVNAFDAVLPLEQREVELHVETEQDWTRISVVDSGRGIPSDLAEKIMQPFFTTKGVGKGTGLGLSISKGLIEVHGGRFFLDTASPHTRFVVELPAQR